jgi:hypothetical protein
MTFSVAVQTRSFAETMAFPAVKLVPERFTRSDKGGPRAATFRAEGGVAALWELTHALRCPIHLYKEGRWVWGGYINEVRIPLGQVDAVATLDTMANKVRMVYTTRKVGDQAAERKRTAWAEDAESVEEYGAKERQLSDSRLNDAEAEARRDAELATYKLPIGDYLPTFNGYGLGLSTGIKSATITCKGWFDTLDWTYYEDTTGLEGYTASTTPKAVKIGQDPFTSAYVRFEGGKIIVGSERHAKETPHVLMLGQNPYSSSSIAFEDADQDRIFKEVGGFSAFVAGATVTVSGASEPTNNGDKHITEVISDTHLVTATDLNDENAGASITLTPRGYSRIGQSFITAGGTISAIRVRAQVAGAAPDGVTLHVYADSAGAPGGASLGSITLPAGSFSTVLDYAEFTPTLGAVSAGATYWFTMERSGSASDAHAYAVAIDNTAAYTRGQCKVWNGSAWVAPPVACDLNFEIVYAPTVDLRGFVAGEQITVSGATNGGNNGTKRIRTADPLELTLEEDTVDEEVGATITLAPESKFVRQGFALGDVTTWDTQEIRLWAKVGGSPSDDLVVNVRLDDGGATLLTTGSVAASEIGTDWTELSILLDDRITMTNPTAYLLGVTRSGASSVMDCYAVRIDEGGSYPRGQCLIALSTTYSPRSPAADLNFMVVGVRNIVDQIEAMLLAGNQFLSGVDMLATSSLYTSPLRNGDTTAKAEIERLVDDAAAGRIRILVDEDRTAHVSNESSSTFEELFMLSDGSLETSTGTKIPKWEAPPGVWVKYKELIAVGSEAGLLADASRFYVEAWEYDVARDRLTATVRGSRATWQIGGMRQG